MKIFVLGERLPTRLFPFVVVSSNPPSPSPFQKTKLTPLNRGIKVKIRKYYVSKSNLLDISVDRKKKKNHPL